MLTIYSNNNISLDGKDTGLGVSQRQTGTVVFVRESVGQKIEYKELTMPSTRYALSGDAPASGVPGRSQFEADLRAVLA